MPKYSIDAMLDASLDEIIDNCDGLILCTSDVLTTGDPDYTKITGASALTAVHAMTSGDFAKDDGDVSGRKATVATQADLPITATGDAAHIVLLDVGSTEVLFMTTCTVQSLTNGNNVSVPAWDIELRDPA